MRFMPKGLLVFRRSIQSRNGLCVVACKKGGDRRKAVSVVILLVDCFIWAVYSVYTSLVFNSLLCYSCRASTK